MKELCAQIQEALCLQQDEDMETSAGKPLTTPGKPASARALSALGPLPEDYRRFLELHDGWRAFGLPLLKLLPTTTSPEQRREALDTVDHAWRRGRNAFALSARGNGIALMDLQTGEIAEFEPSEHEDNVLIVTHTSFGEFLRFHLEEVHGWHRICLALEEEDDESVFAAVGKQPHLRWIRRLSEERDDFLLPLAPVILAMPHVEPEVAHIMVQYGIEEPNAYELLESLRPWVDADTCDFMASRGELHVRKKNFAKALVLYELAMSCTTLAPRHYHGATWVAQRDNSGIHIDSDRVRRFIRAAAPHAVQAPAIYLNLVCLWFELDELDEALAVIETAFERGVEAGEFEKEPYIHAFVDTDRYRMLKARYFTEDDDDDEFD